MQALIQAAQEYAGKAGLEERLAAASVLQQQVLACCPKAIGSAVQGQTDPTAYVRAVLVGARPGLTGAAPTAQQASELTAARLAAYKASLARLGGSLEGPAEGGDTAGAGSTATAALTEQQAKALVSVLDSELGSNTSAGDLSDIAEAALAAFEGDAPLGCAALELLPKALALLQAAGRELDGGGGTASDACQGIISRVCQHKWPLPAISRVLESLRGFPLTQAHLREAVLKATQLARSADAQDLPAVVHQLLTLSTRGCRELILSEVMRLFEDREAKEEDQAHKRRQLLEVQGSVLLHMDMAVKHDAELGAAWLRQLRGEAPPRLSPFPLAVSFMLAGIQRFEQPVIDALKSLVLNAYKDAAVLASSPWLQQPEPGHSAAPSCGAGQAAALRAALLQCARNSGAGQGGIVQPMVALAVGLIESGGGQAGSGSGGGSRGAAADCDDASEEEPAAASSAPPAQRAAALGARLLLELFQAARHELRREILCLCHNRLIGAKEEVAAPYVRLLALLVRRNQATIGDYMQEMRLSLEHLALLPPNAALSLLLAVWPMCRSRRDAQDYIVMLLRKAMFSREVHARLLAARGFLYLITQELESSSGSGSGGGGGGFDANEAGPSQATMSQLGSLTGRGTGGATLLHEVMSFLRRCLTQQPEVRRAVYDGMPVLLAADPSVQESVVEPLLPHFLQFYEADENATPPLKFEKCVRLQGDGARVLEPLQHLLAGVRRVLRSTAGAGEGQQAGEPGGGGCNDLDGSSASATAALRSRFGALRRRLADARLEHFHFDLQTDFTAGTGEGDLHLAEAGMLLGCFEVAMEDIVDELTEGLGASAGGASADDDREGSQQQDAESLGKALLCLHAEHKRLLDLAAQCQRGRGNQGQKVEGLTQAVGAARRAPGRPTAGAAAAAAAAQQAAIVPLDKRVPALSLGCLAKLLDAITDDGFKRGPDAPTGPASMAADVSLSRDKAFQAFALGATLRHLQACQASELLAAIVTGTAGSAEDEASVRLLFAVPDWHQLACPLFRAVNTMVLSHCKARNHAAGCGAKKDPTEGLTQAAMKALHQLLSMAATEGGTAGMTAVLGQLPMPSDEAVAAAELPALEGLPAAQRTIAERLPLFHALLGAVLKPSCARELEQLCGGLALLAGLVPPPFADAIAGWAVAGCEEMSGLTWPAAAKALLALALRGRAAATTAPAAAAGSGARAGAAGAGDGMAGSGDDVELLILLAADIKEYLAPEERPIEGEAFALLNDRTLGALVGAIGAHLDATLNNLEWVLGKVRAMGAASKAALDAGTIGAYNRLQKQRQEWESAALQRLNRATQVMVLLSEAQLQGGACEALVKSLTRLYKLLVVAAKAQLAPRGVKQWVLPSSFVDLVNWVNQKSTPPVYNFIQEVHGQEEGQENGEAKEANQEEHGQDAEKVAKKKAREWAVAASKLKRELKQVPALIYQIEEFERLLIRLSKASSDGSVKVNLMQAARRATVRDFKLRPKHAEDEEQQQQQQEGGRRVKRQCQEQEEEVGGDAEMAGSDGEGGEEEGEEEMDDDGEEDSIE